MLSPMNIDPTRPPSSFQIVASFPFLGQEYFLIPAQELVISGPDRAACLVPILVEDP
jgi:hypothetical protein